MVKIFIAARQGGGLEGPGGRQITAAAPLSSLMIEALESKRFSARLQGQAISDSRELPSSWCFFRVQ